MSLLAAIATAVFAARVAALLLGVETLAVPASERRRPARATLRAGLAAIGGAPVAAGCAGAGVLGYLGCAAVSGPIVAVVPALLASTQPARLHRRRLAAERRVVRGAWPAALRDVSMAVGAGRSLHQALAVLGSTGPEPLRAVFDEYAALYRTIGMAGALEHVRAVLDDAIADRVVEVLLVAAERGGGTVRAVLDDLVSGITDELALLETTDTEALEGRINAQAVVALPWIALVLLTAAEGPFRDFYRTPAGLLTVLVGGACSGIGAIAVGRLARVPEDPRVVRGTVS